MQVSVSQKVMLNGLVGACEACTAFEQLYTASILQQLELPLRYVSLPVFISGFGSVPLLTLIGWLSDRGSNTHVRKMAAVLLSSGLMVSGMATVIVANALHFSQTRSHQYQDNSSNIIQDFTGCPPSSNTTNMSDVTSRPTSNQTRPTACIDQGKNSVEGPTSPYAWLAIVGFAFLDCGFDLANSFGRSWALACLPFAEHASLLKVAVVVSSAGVAVVATLGLVDLDSLLATKGSVVNIQGTIVLTLVSVGTMTSLVTGHQLHGRTDKDENRSKLNGRHDSTEYACLNQDVPSDENTDVFHDTVVDKTCTQRDPGEMDNSSEEEPIDGETTPILSSGTSNISPLTSKNAPFSQNISRHISSRLLFYFQRLCPWPMTCPNRGFKWKMTNIFLGTYFSTGAILLFEFLAADYTGKAIYGGSPQAEEGSMEAERYQEGIRMSAWSLLAYSAAFLLYSFVQYRVLDLCGFRMEFVISQLFVGLVFALLAVTSRLELLFVLASTAGIRRASQCVVPYKLANDAMREQTEKTKSQSQVGTAMALVGGTAPLSACTLYPWVGLLEEKTGSTATRMWMGAMYAVLAAVFFAILPAK